MPNSTSPLYDCPFCGAPLNLADPGHEGACAYCGRRIKQPEYESPDAGQDRTPHESAAAHPSGTNDAPGCIAVTAGAFGYLLVFTGVFAVLTDDDTASDLILILVGISLLPRFWALVKSRLGERFACPLVRIALPFLLMALLGATLP